MDEDVVEEEHHGVCEVKENKEVDKVLDENVKEHTFSEEEKEVNVNELKEMPVESGKKQGGEALGMMSLMLKVIIKCIKRKQDVFQWTVSQILC